MKQAIKADYWKEKALEIKSAKPSERSRIIDEMEVETNRKRSTIYNNLKVKGGLDLGRQKRSDAGSTSFPDLKIHISKISTIYLKRVTKIKDGTINNMSVQRAVKIYQDSLPKPVKLPTTETITAILRKNGQSKKHANQPKPWIRMKSTAVNVDWQLDASVCRLYLDEKKNLQAFSRGTAYKNKPVWDDGKKTKIYRWGVVDTFSLSCIFLYFRTEQKEDIAKFLYYAFSPYHSLYTPDDFTASRQKRRDALGIRTKEDLEEMAEYYPFHGVPQRILTDNGPALRSHAIQGLMNYLDIELPPVTPHSPRVKGVIERMHKWWETEFESGLILQPPRSIEELNQMAIKTSIDLHNDRIVRRTGLSRNACWQQINHENLREVPNYSTYTTLLHSDPETRDVDGNSKISFDGREYTINGIFNTTVDVIKHAFRYKTDEAITVQYPSRTLNQRNFQAEEIQTLTVLPDGKVAGGYSSQAVAFGTYGTTKTNPKIEELKEIEAAGDELQLKPFDDMKVNKQSFIPKHGKLIIPIGNIEPSEKTYTEIRAKGWIADQIGGMLLPWQIKYIDGLGKELFTEADLEQILNQLNSMEKPREEKNA